MSESSIPAEEQAPQETPAAPVAKAPYIYAAFWGGLLAIVLGISCWGYFSKPGDKPLSVQAQLEPNQKLFWKSGFPHIGAAITLGNAKAATVTAKRFAFEGWGQARFMFDIFGAAPLAGAKPGIFRVPTIDLNSHVNFDSDAPTHLRILFYRGATWRSFEQGNATLLISTLASLSDKRDDHVMQGLVYVTGTDATKFSFTASDRSECKPECKGTFGDFKGNIYLTDPPRYDGPGAAGITRIVINGGTDAAMRVSGYQQGFTLFAVQPAEFHIDEYAEVAEFRANRGSLIFNGQLFPLGPAAPLRMSFSESNPARIEISSGGMAALRLDGTANQVYLGDEDLMPRRIDGWGWYWQVLIGAIVSFCGERLFSLFRGIDFKKFGQVAKAELATSK